MELKEVLSVLLVIWILTLPIIYFFSPFLGILGGLLDEQQTGISYSTRENRLENFNKLLSQVDENISVYNVIGNHELKCRENKDEVYSDYYGILEHANNPIIAPNSKCPYYWYSWNLNGYHFIALHTAEKLNPSLFEGGVPKYLFDKTYTLSKKQLNWLRNDLENTNKPTLVFCHIPIDDYGIAGYDTISNRKKIRSILARSGNVVAVVEAHSHHPGAPDWDGYKWMEDGIPYFYLPPLGAPLGGPRYSMISLKPNEKKALIETHFIGEETSLFSKERWEVPIEQTHSSSGLIKTNFNIQEGKNQFILSNLDPNENYRARIVWENYRGKMPAEESNKWFRNKYTSGVSENFSFKLQNFSYEIENSDENMKIIEVENLKMVDNKIFITYQSTSELYKTSLHINKVPEKKLKIGVFNDFHWGPKRSELFSKEKAKSVFSDFVEAMNNEEVDFILNNGDWIDGQKPR